MKLTVNEADVEVDDRHAKTPLLWVLRDRLGMHGTTFGCEVGWGQTLAAISPLESNPAPDAARIALWMNGNLCRCGTHLTWDFDGTLAN
jgi:aerobic-type carbon monoxide dehydrogenase small subunit (CoxS/CutS family)